MISVLDLARQFGVSTTALRESLTQFSRFGLIERRENSGWVFLGMTSEFAADLYEIREMFELRSARLFIRLSDDDPSWSELATLEKEQHQLLRDIHGRHTDFSRLDERLHRLIHEASDNRFIREFYDVIAFIFHYHYQWNRIDELERNRLALKEHLAYISAIRSRQASMVTETCLTHLRTTRVAFMRSIH